MSKRGCLEMMLKKIRRYTFVDVAVDARVQFVRDFRAMGAIFGRFSTHDSDPKLMTILYWCKFNSSAIIVRD